VITSSLLAIRKLITTLPANQIEDLKEPLKTLLKDGKFWKHGKTTITSVYFKQNEILFLHYIFTVFKKEILFLHYIFTVLKKEILFLHYIFTVFKKIIAIFFSLHIYKIVKNKENLKTLLKDGKFWKHGKTTITSVYFKQNLIPIISFKSFLYFLLFCKYVERKK
jgi:hypothetical protein